MKLNKVMMVGLLIFGGILNGCSTMDSVDEVRELATKVTQHEEKIKEYEAKLTAVLDDAEAKLPAFNEVFDLDKDGKVTKEEVGEVLKSNPGSFVGLVKNDWESGNWGSLLLLVLTFMGLHTADAKERIKHYGSRGILGRIFFVLGLIDKDEPKKDKEE